MFSTIPFFAPFFFEHKLDAAAHSLLEHGRLEEELTGENSAEKKNRQKKREKRGNQKTVASSMFSRYPLRLV